MPTTPRPQRAAKAHQAEIWAQLILRSRDAAAIRGFLRDAGVDDRFIVRRMHLTVYHARRPMPGLWPMREAAAVLLSAADTRFMLLAPGGENPRSDLDPSVAPVGIRVRRASEAFDGLLGYRRRFFPHETRRVLGRRAPSSRRASAFGARCFQPHIALLRRGHGLGVPLDEMGRRFRSFFREPFLFDGFLVDVVAPAGRAATAAGRDRLG